ncbi:spermidine synthase [Aureococcus anophagefferens]|uniref:Spermidine synthase n=1 Tax=Aureococcus anophagefferens TaxID=44056 RepID=A0ABR1GAZ1_AURAN
MSAKAISESPYHVKLKGEKSRRKKKAFRAKEAPPPASPGKRDLLDDHDLVPVEFEAGGEDGTVAGFGTGKKICVVVVVWLAVGTAIYSVLNGWPVPQSCYYASWFDHLETLEETAKSQSLSLIGVFTGKQKLDLDGDGDADVWDRSAVIGKYLNSTATAFFALWVWVGFGTIFGMVSQKWTFVRSVYFSVAAMSTAGLQAPNTLGDGDMDDSVAWFVSIFCVFGIPIFGVAVGSGANLVLGYILEAKPIKQVLLTKDDFDNVKDLIASDHVLDFGEFVILELIRQGNVDMETVEGLRDAFEKIDVNGDGTLDRAEVHRYHKATTLRYRYAAYLTKSRGLSRTFALESALELDIEYLVLKAKKLGWLVPVPAAEDKPFEVLIDALDSPDKPDKPDKPASPASRVTPQDK